LVGVLGERQGEDTERSDPRVARELADANRSSLKAAFPAVPVDVFDVDVPAVVPLVLEDPAERLDAPELGHDDLAGGEDLPDRAVVDHARGPRGGEALEGRSEDGL